MPVQQHPVPQHIASYEFRLVGDMTLRQFGYLAVGTVIALIFYGTPLPDIIKWPLILLSGFSGFAFAFMPIEGRPLTTWIIAFIKAVFSPTQFIWQKRLEEPEIFAPIAHLPVLAKTAIIPTDKSQLMEYLKTLPGENPLDKQEQVFLQNISTLFKSGAPAISPLPPKIPLQKPRLEIPTIKVAPQPSIKVTPPPQKPPIRKTIILPQRPGRPRKPTVAPKINPQLLIPSLPTRPNILTGMVLNQKGEIIEGAILEIRNSKGIPVRALKTNLLGQFTIATPLENDIYEIEIEKEGFSFDIIKIEAKGEIIKPLEIRAK